MSGTLSGSIRWREWSTQAFEDAKAANKPILLDISAVWCHWCHVMDRTSYSDPEVIRLVNELYVPIRVESDTRPDINARYNQGGWPTTAFLTPTGELVHGATFVPPEQMRRLLVEVNRVYHQSRATIQAKADELRRQQSTRRPHAVPPAIPEGTLEEIVHAIEHNFDPEHGGFGTEPKFPAPDAIDFALERHVTTGDPHLLEIVTRTLDGMMGLYDRIDGGFHRYSVSVDWTVPHYEKMLEINAELAVSYARGYAVTGDERYAEIARGAITYMLGALHDDAGGFYGSQDADVGSHAEGAEFVTGEDYFPLSREERARIGTPHVDKTVYSGWNGMSITALVEAHRELGEALYLAEAEKTADMLLKAGADPEGALWRMVGNSAGPAGLLADQAYVARGLLDVHEATGNPRFLDGAKRVVAYVQKHLFDAEGGGFFDIPEGESGLGSLSERQKSLVENSVMAQVLLRLHGLTGEERYHSEAELTLRAFAGRHRAHGFFGAAYGQAVEMLLRPVRAAVIGPETEPATEALWRATYRAFSLGAVRRRLVPGRDDAAISALWYPLDTVATAHLCAGKMCRTTTDPNEAAAILRHKGAP